MALYLYKGRALTRRSFSGKLKSTLTTQIFPLIALDATVNLTGQGHGNPGNPMRVKEKEKKNNNNKPDVRHLTYIARTGDLERLASIVWSGLYSEVKFQSDLCSKSVIELFVSDWGRSAPIADLLLVTMFEYILIVTVACFRRLSFQAQAVVLLRYGAACLPCNATKHGQTCGGGQRYVNAFLIH